MGASAQLINNSASFRGPLLQVQGIYVDDQSSQQNDAAQRQFPHNSAVSLPEAHQVDPSPQFENAAFSLRPNGQLLFDSVFGFDVGAEWHPESSPKPQ
jgi:hypothetical protein